MDEIILFLNEKLLNFIFIEKSFKIFRLSLLILIRNHIKHYLGIKPLIVTVMDVSCDTDFENS